MTIFKLKILTMLLISTSSFAFAGNTGVGGGDACEDQIKVIRDDIRGWILSGGPKSLVLPQGLSTEQYSQRMMDQITFAKIRCVAEGDQGFPVTVSGTPKTCRFDVSDKSITCDTVKFNKTGIDDQYVLVHHEFAGLADIEPPVGDDSKYAISNQMVSYLENRVVKKLGLKPIGNAPLDMIFQKIPAGSFIMGSPDEETGRHENELQHKVTLTHDFEMQITTVTQYQWVKVMGNNPSAYKKVKDCPKTFMTMNGVNLCPDHPVEVVSYDSAHDFINRLNALQSDGYVYRLPTEAEWEYATRAGSDMAYFFGETFDLARQFAVFDRGQTDDVGPKRNFNNKPNAFGLYDMQGNVSQWVEDAYNANYLAINNEDPVNCPSAEFQRAAPYMGNQCVPDKENASLGSRVKRGVGYLASWEFLRSAVRSYYVHQFVTDHLGFRLVRNH